MRMMGVESVAYHRSTVMDRSDDHPGAAQSYYSSKGETPLVWGGGGAAQLGLAGHVTPEHYEDLFGPGGARDPLTGLRLATTKRPGLELVVSAHKSVAELGVIGRVEDMHAILDAETAGTLEYLEQLTQEQGGRRGRTATRTPTSGMTYAVTRHATSRAGDPNPHDHVLIANVVEMLDDRGGWKAADTALWREHLHAATAYGRVRSAQVAVELGYGIQADSGRSGRLGHWAIAGIPDEAMAIHSKRAGQIDSALGAGAETAYRERAIAARRTRTAKNHEPVDDLVERWRRELTTRGIDIGAIDAAVHVQGHRRITGNLDDLALDRLAGRLLESDGRLAADKVFSRRDVVVVAAPYLFGLDPGVLDDLVDRVLAHPSAVELEPNVSGRDAVYAPRCVIDTERAIAEKARHRHQLDTAPVIPTTVVDGALRLTERANGLELTESQRRAVRGVCASGRSLDVIIGVAGAGKTTALSAVREACELDGRRVIAAATSGQAARTVGEDTGIESYTVASLAYRLRTDTITLDSKSVVILDEAGMTDDRDLLNLIDQTWFAGAKLILVGDDRQLSAVGPGGGLRALAERYHASLWELSENIRQPDLGERVALAELRSGTVEHAVHWMDRNQRIVTAPDRPELYGAVVDGWLADLDLGSSTLMLAWKRNTVAALNQLARTAYTDRGWLTGPEIIAPGGTPYRAGDRVVALARLAEDVPTSQTGVVGPVDQSSGYVHVDFDNGASYKVPISRMGADGMAHGYAVTVHRAQGATVDTTHTVEDGGGRELAYVASSRGRQRNTVYVEADNLEQAIEDLTQSWATERRQQWITDSLDRLQASPPTREASEAPDLGIGL
jgi:conjugative relaxase-like TrwC/TraI family protein